MMTHKLLPALLTLILALAGCGGGGEDGDATGTPAPMNAGLQLTVPAPTYPAASEELQAFQVLNGARSRCGHGQLAQSAALDSAAQGQAEWLVYNQIVEHQQTAGTPRFTGITPMDRALAAGYGASPFLFQATEQFYYLADPASGNQTAGFGEYFTRGLLNAPYHANGMLDGYRDVGIALRSAADAGAPDAHIPGAGRKVLVFNPGYMYRSGNQAEAQADDAVLTYPCDGETGVGIALYDETPNPVPGRDLAIQPLGTSLMVSLKAGRTLDILSATLQNTHTGAFATMRPPVTQANDPHSLFEPHQGYVAADAPLSPHTTYRATLQGRNNGVSFTKTFLFVTGAD